jgi:hypothetical protein
MRRMLRVPGDRRRSCAGAGLALTSAPFENRAAMNRIVAQPQIVTSARMAAGMTSRARRFPPCIPAG